VKTRRDSAEVHAKCKSVLVIDGKYHEQQCRDNGMEMESSTSDRWIPFRSVNSKSQGSNSWQKIVKCETPKSLNRHINKGFGYQELEESRVKTLHHKSLEVEK
jgi:hypothetical protein